MNDAKSLNRPHNVHIMPSTRQNTMVAFLEPLQGYHLTYQKEHLKWYTTLRQMWQSMLCQTMHVRVASDT